MSEAQVVDSLSGNDDQRRPRRRIDTSPTIVRILQLQVVAPTDAAIMLAVQQGLPASCLALTLSSTGLSEAAQRDLRDDILQGASLVGRASLSEAEGERLWRVARIVALADILCDGAPSRGAFLITPNTRLDGRSPLSCAGDAAGVAQVQTMVERALIASET